jgi:hypothetical protein
MEGINEVMESSGAPTGGQGKLLFMTHIIHLGVQQQPLQEFFFHFLCRVQFTNIFGIL